MSLTADVAAHRLLVIEDDLEVAQTVVGEFSQRGFAVTHIVNGLEGLAEASSGTYDVMVVDRGLPELDGLRIIETLRTRNVLTPALILSASGEVNDRVLGLETGADDYLAKPFALIELTARVAALLRRRATGRETTLWSGPLELDLIDRVLRKNGTVIDLLPREFDLLEFLMRHAGTVVTRSMLLENVWHYNHATVTNVVDVYIGKLRRKIDEPGGTHLIQNVKGVGFMLTTDV
jgi:two-component system OmpR family response regulator